MRVIKIRFKNKEYKKAINFFNGKENLIEASKDIILEHIREHKRIEKGLKSGEIGQINGLIIDNSGFEAMKEQNFDFNKNLESLFKEIKKNEH